MPAPKSVSVSLRVVRSKSCSPSWVSSMAMRRDTVDLGNSARCAARLKLPASTTWENRMRSFESIAMLSLLCRKQDNDIQFYGFRIDNGIIMMSLRRTIKEDLHEHGNCKGTGFHHAAPDYLPHSRTETRRDQPRPEPRGCGRADQATSTPCRTRGRRSAGTPIRASPR